MLSLEQIIQNTKQKYQFNMLQIRNVLKKLAFLTGVSYFKGKREELKFGAWRWGHVAAGAGMPGSKLAKPNFCKYNTFLHPSEVFINIFVCLFLKLRSKSLFSPVEGEIHSESMDQSLLPPSCLVRDATPRRH